MPAFSTPTSWVAIMVRMGNTMPQAPTPTVFQMKSLVVLWEAYWASCSDRPPSPKAPITRSNHWLARRVIGLPRRGAAGRCGAV